MLQHTARSSFRHPFYKSLIVFPFAVYSHYEGTLLAWVHSYTRRAYVSTMLHTCMYNVVHVVYVRSYVQYA